METRVCTHRNPFESLSSLKLPACWDECFRPSVSPWGRETLTSPLTLKATEIRIAEDGDSGHVYALASAAYGRLGHGPAAHVFGPPKALHQLWDMLNPFSPCLEETATDEQACNVFSPPIVLCQPWVLMDLFSRLEEGASTNSMVLAACFNAPPNIRPSPTSPTLSHLQAAKERTTYWSQLTTQFVPLPIPMECPQVHQPALGPPSFSFSEQPHH